MPPVRLPCTCRRSLTFPTPCAGNARVYECLESHRNDEGFSPECKDEFEKMMERRAADFRLDFKLREMCKRDIDQLCSYEKESLDSVEGFDARVIVCLQDFRDELADEECRNAVHRVIQRAAEDIRFDEPLADACFQDRKQYCPGAHAVRLLYECACWWCGAQRYGAHNDMVHTRQDHVLQCPTHHETTHIMR